MPLQNRVASIVALTALALVASCALDWPTRDVVLAGRSFPLSGSAVLGAIALGLVCTGTGALVRSDPKGRRKRLHRPFLRCILPTAVALAALVLLTRLPHRESRLMGTAITAGALAVLMAAEYYAAGPAAAGRGVVRVLLQLATYSVAALLFGAVHSTTLDVNAARAGAVVGAILALRLLGEDEHSLGRILWAGASVGLLLGAISWLLHAQMASAVTYALALVTLLYVLVGLAREFLRGTLRREVMMEYLLVGLVALTLLLFYGP